MNCEVKYDQLRIWYEDKGECSIDFCMKIMDTARKESCGRDVLCREGTWQAYEIIKGIAEGDTRSGDYELLQEILDQIRQNASCEMSRTAASICLKLTSDKEEEWDQHIRRKRCTKLICKSSFTVYIDPLICNGCGICKQKCPHSAITGGKGLIHLIDTNACRKSLACMDVCPVNAIKKAGSTLLKLPKEPIPVGTFIEVNDESKETSGGRRRRRRDV